MMSTDPQRNWSPARLGLALAAPALLAAACGGATGAYSNGGTATKGAAATSSTAAAKVETHSGGLGTFLTDGSGRTLYLFAADHGHTSSCSGACASVWSPLTTKGAATAAGQVKAGMLSTTDRGGARQVTYGGHPLYYFSGDQGAGQTTGQGSNEFGAQWWVVSPAGSAITHAAAAASTPKPSSGSSSSTSGGGAWG